MRNYRVLLSLLCIAALTWGCPDDGPNGEPQPDAGVPGDDVSEPDADLDITYPEVDVWVDGRNDDFDSATPIDAGQSFGGVIEAGQGEDYDLSIFAVELEAGTIFSFEFTHIGEGMMLDGVPMAFASLEDEDEGGLYRGLDSERGMGREVFIPATGTYYIIIGDVRAGTEAHGGPTSYFGMQTSTRAVDASATSVPGTESADMGDGAVLAYDVTAAEAGVVSAETFAMRPPIGSELDTVLYAWNTTTNAVVAFNDDVDLEGGIYDSLVVWEATAGETYYVIVDTYTNSDDAALEIVFAISDDHPRFPRDLALGGSVDAELLEAVDGVADVDYFWIDLEPGQTVRVQVEADEAMQPFIAAYDGWGFPVGIAAPVDGRAAMTFAHGADEEEADGFYIIVQDRRNVVLEEGETAQSVGGTGFGYTISAALAPWAPVAETLPLEAEGTIGDVGFVNWYTFELPASHIVQLVVETANEDFLPQVGQLSAAGYDFFLESPAAFVQGAEASSVTLGVRDRYFRGGEGYVYTPNFRAFDPTTVTFEAVTSESVGTIAASQELTLPVAVSGTLTARTLSDLAPHHYKFTLEAGQTLVLRTEGGETTDTILRLVNAAGEVFIENDFHFGQSGTYYSALIYDVLLDGDYFLVVEPYCTSEASEGCEGSGAYVLEAFDGATPAVIVE